MLMSYQNFSHSKKFVATHVHLGVKTQKEHKNYFVFATHTKQQLPSTHRNTNKPTVCALHVLTSGIQYPNEIIVNCNF